MDNILELNPDEIRNHKESINHFRNKQTNHLRVIISLWISFAFGLFSIEDILVLIAFMILVLLIFLHFFDRFRYYLLAESATQYQAGLADNSVVEGLLEKIKPRRTEWWKDEKWFSNFRHEASKEHPLSFIFLIWIFTPKSRKITAFLSVIWGSLIISRLFQKEIASNPLLSKIYNWVSSNIVCFYRFLENKNLPFIGSKIDTSNLFMTTMFFTIIFCIIILIVLYICFVKGPLINIKVWKIPLRVCGKGLRGSRNDLSLKKIKIKNDSTDKDPPKFNNLEEYCEKDLFDKIKDLDFLAFKERKEEFFQKYFEIDKLEDFVYSCWVTVKIEKNK